MEKVKVRLQGRQKDADGKTSKVDMSAEGEYSLRAGKRYVKYLDKTIDKDNPVSTMLKITEDSLTIMRYGAVGGTQRFVKGEEHVSEYQTPYGNLELRLHTTKLNVSLKEKSGQVDFAYNVAVNGEPSGHNKLVVSWNIL